MELNREQIIKALECCHTPLASDCNDCGYRGQSVENGEYIGCSNRLMADALSLIKELTEEKERLRAERDLRDVVVKDLTERNKYLQQTNEALGHFCIDIENELYRKHTLAVDTVREFAERLKQVLRKDDRMNYYLRVTIEQLEKEFIGNENTEKA